jgi:hypothetical protein
LEMLDNIDLVEKYKRVQNAERRVVEDARKNNILEVLKSVRVVVLVLYPYDLFELGFVGKVLSVIGFV